MKITRGQIVPLGYGKYIRSDRFVGMEPIEEGRGPGRRTRVWAEGVADALIASRSDSAIVRDLVSPTDVGMRAAEQRQLLADILDTIHALDPVLRSIIRDQAKWDLNRLEERLKQTLGAEATEPSD